jgi:hypothetical protein
MMRAVIDRIQPCTIAFKIFAQAFMYGLNHLFGKVTAGNACLIGNYDRKPTIFI